MKFKEYLFTSLVFVNLAIGASNLRVEEYAFTQKKNKEILKVSFNQETIHTVQSVGTDVKFFDKASVLNTLLILGIVFGAMMFFSEHRKISKSKKNNTIASKNVSRETFLSIVTFSKNKFSYYMGIILKSTPKPQIQFI